MKCVLFSQCEAGESLAYRMAGTDLDGVDGLAVELFLLSYLHVESELWCLGLSSVAVFGGEEFISGCSVVAHALKTLLPA